MSSNRFFIFVASNNGVFFSNAFRWDTVMYPESNTQKVLIGNNANVAAALTISSNLTQFATNNVYFSNVVVGIGVSNPTTALAVIGDIYGSSNMYIGSNMAPAQSNAVMIDPAGTTGNVICSGNVSAGNLGMFRNRIINGDMRINQRQVTSCNTLTGATTVYMIDRCAVSYSITTGALTQSNIPLTSNDIPWKYGLRNSWRITASTACTSYSWLLPLQSIEGYNSDDFNWGTSYGMPVTLSFWMRTNVATNGKIPITLRNGSYTYSYNNDINVASSGNWQYVTQTIPAPPNASVWMTSSNVGMNVIIGGIQTGVAPSNGWVATNGVSLSTSTNIWGTLQC